MKKLLSDEIKLRAKKNLVQSKAFSELLDRAIKKYQNQSVQTAQVIEELIGLAKEMKAATKRGEKLKLTEDELAFYDPFGTNDSAVKVLGDETLRKIAQELTISIRNSITVDWTIRESVKARLRIMVKRLLSKYGYPPDKQAAATETVLKDILSSKATQ